jgi:putative Mn2+ efflux pump MntP
MLQKTAILIIGVVLILMGVQAFFVGGYRSEMWGRYISYPCPRIIGAIFVIVGFFFVYNIMKTISRDRKKRPPRKDD